MKLIIDESSIVNQLEELNLTAEQKEAWLRGEFDIWDNELTVPKAIDMHSYDEAKAKAYRGVDYARHGEEITEAKAVHEALYSPRFKRANQWEQRALAKSIAVEKRRKANKAARKARRNG